MRSTMPCVTEGLSQRKLSYASRPKAPLSRCSERQMDGICLKRSHVRRVCVRSRRRQ